LPDDHGEKYETDNSRYQNLRHTQFISHRQKRDGDQVYHTYSTYARGLDRLNAAYAYIDLLPLGRNEADLPFPMAWVRRNDSY
tara:strand:+ start:53 stop:301 length:249 start_codon:yes stop_codon:yes gene_type:complete